MSDPTPAEIQQAIEDGMKAHGEGIGSHHTNGQLRCDYKHPALVKAWLQGFDVARHKAIRRG